MISLKKTAYKKEKVNHHMQYVLRTWMVKLDDNSCLHTFIYCLTADTSCAEKIME